MRRTDLLIYGFARRARYFEKTVGTTNLLLKTMPGDMQLGTGCVTAGHQLAYLRRQCTACINRAANIDTNLPTNNAVLIDPKLTLQCDNWHETGLTATNVQLCRTYGMLDL